MPATTKLQFSDIPSCIDAFRRGEFLIVLDDPTRENEGDLVIAAQHLTPSKCAFMIRHTSGYLCAPLTRARAKLLDLPAMISENRSTDPKRTAYCISVDALGGTGTATGTAQPNGSNSHTRQTNGTATHSPQVNGSTTPSPQANGSTTPSPQVNGSTTQSPQSTGHFANGSPLSGGHAEHPEAMGKVTTGISAHDRSTTCRTLASPYARAQHLSRPGHILPLLAKDGGVRERRGHTEASVEFARLAGLDPAVAVIGELVIDGQERVGTALGQAARVPEYEESGMMRAEECVEFGRLWGIRCCTIEDLVAYVEDTEGRLR